MKLTKISLEFSYEELEAIHYAILIGVRVYKREKYTNADDLIDIAENIRSKLPINLKIQGSN
jgi:hypothetical protein